MRHPSKVMTNVATSTLFLLLGLAACTGGGTNIGTSVTGPQPSPLQPSTATKGLRFATVIGGAKGGADGTGVAAQFDGPTGLDVASSGRVILAEAGGHRIRAIETGHRASLVAGDVRGRLDGVRAEARFSGPNGVAIRRDGSVVVADTGNHQIRVVGPGGTVTTLAGDGVAGHQDGPSAVARFNAPYGVAVTALDEVLVADTGNHRIRLIDRGGVVSTLFGGSPGYVDGGFEHARLNGPMDLVIDEAGRVYVADLRNHAIRRFDLSARHVQTFCGTAEPGDQDGDAKTTRLRYPSGLAIDASNLIFVADAGNGVIKRLTAEGRSSTIARFSDASPADIGVAADGTLYVTDPGNHRVLSSKHLEGRADQYQASW